MIEFAYPWLFILLVLPVFITWLTPSYKERKDSVKVPYFARLVDLTGEKPQHGAVLLSRNNIQRFIVALSWLCFVTAMAKPEHVGEPIIQQKSARDLMIAVDLSGSMAVKDFTLNGEDKVDRLQAVKSVLSTFAQGRKHDRLGLILFGDAAYLQAPFTADISTWLTLLEESQIGMAGQSTAFGDAIGLSIGIFDKSPTKNRVLIALTDGNDNGSKVPPLDAAKVAATYHIKIYTIAVGDPTAVGEEKVDLAVLKKISELTGGKSYQALDQAQLQSVYREINTLEPQLYDTQSFRPKKSIHHYPIIAFALLYIFALSLVNFKYYSKLKGLFSARTISKSQKSSHIDKIKAKE